MAGQTSSYRNISPFPCVTDRRRKYDVFVSFRGADTRRDFGDHLYVALDRAGISTFRDEDDLELGEDISGKLLKVLEESRISIVILSRNYASSAWCLDELAKIVECRKVKGQTVLPVFYDVDPSEVRKQTGTVREAFAKLQVRFQDSREKLRTWRDALNEVGNLSGFHVQDRFEAQSIQQIVKVVVKTLQPAVLKVVVHPVGIESRLKEINGLLDIQSNDVRFIGIWGMGGIGKTTIAQAIFNKFVDEFETSAVLPNIRVESEVRGLPKLQMFLLYEILMQNNIHVLNVDEGATMIKNILCKKKVLLILDDVDKLDQLESLAGNKDWFGLGSRIIITTRDEKLLRKHGVEKIFEVKELSVDESLELFSYKAFATVKPPEEYLDLSKLVVNYATRLPLALEVLGSFLMGRSMIEWKGALQKLETITQGEVFDVLKISYDGLQVNEKNIFLDIACFFNGTDKDRVEEILDYFGFNPKDGLQVLIEKSLITILDNKVLMNEHIQEMGRQVVHKESVKEPGKQSRLWLHDDIIRVLKNNTGTDAVEGIALDLPKLEEACWNLDAFLKMYNLRFLQIHNLQMDQGPKYLSNALKFLEWSGYPSEFLPQGFQPEELCELNLSHSSIGQLWKGTECLGNLKLINVSNCQNLTKTPDFTVTPNLHRLILEGCTNLVKIHPSIAKLKRLILLNLKDCRSLECVPDYFEMESLKTFILSGCSKIKNIPGFVRPMEHLLELFLDKTAIEHLPSSIECLTGLTSLNLRDCKNLKSLASEICKLRSLKSLNICGCTNLENLPEGLGKIDCLEELDVGGTSISELPSSFFVLENVKVLSLRGCKGLPLESENIHLQDPLLPRNRRCPGGLMFQKTYSGLRSLIELNLSDCNLPDGTMLENLGCLSSLVSLNLSRNNIFSLPKSIRQLSKLCNLNLESCKSLQKLPELSETMNFIIGEEGSYSLERLSSCFNFINCVKVVDNQGCNNIASSVLRRFLQGFPYAGNRFETIYPGSEMSTWFSYQSAGPVVSMDLTENWYKGKWVGFAVCAVFVLRRHLPGPSNHLGKWTYGTYNTAHGLRCEMKPNNLGTSGWCPFLGCSKELGQIESDHLWLSFVSREYFGTAWQDGCRHLEFSFKTVGPGLEVKQCGVRFIYEQDLVGIESLLQPCLT